VVSKERKHHIQTSFHLESSLAKPTKLFFPKTPNKHRMILSHFNQGRFEQINVRELSLKGLILKHFQRLCSSYHDDSIL